MIHIPELIQDLAIVLGFAAVVSVLFHRIKQPVVLGYICSGIAASLLIERPGSFSSELRTLADLGVIFLMFSLGLEFSFRKLFRLGGRVAFTALFEVGAVLAGGAALASILGFGRSAWLIGAMLAISSTTIIFKALDEAGLKTRRFAQYVLGILIFEDLIAILLMVAVGAPQEGVLAHSLASLILFVGGWFLFGTFVLPPLLKRIGKSHSEETLMIVSVSLCLGLGMAAASLGFSPGLGAFLMGSILAESTESLRIERLIHPLRDLFVAVFFVSIGMLVDPALVWKHQTLILALSAYVILAKLGFAALGSVLSGQTLKSSILIGGSLTQIGEFSFIIAGLAIAAGHTDPELLPIIVSVSVLTTLTTPYFIRLAPSIAKGVERLMPIRLGLLIDQYSSWTELRSAREEPHPERRAAFLRWVLSGFIVTVVSRIATQYASPSVGFAVALFTLPFLWGFLRGVELPEKFRLLRTATQALALLICALLAWPFFKGTPITWMVALASVVLIVRLLGQIGLVFQWFEETFLSTLSEGRKKNHGRQALLKKLAPWEGQLIRLKIHPDSEYSGRTIQEAALRNHLGLNIVAIQRGSKLIVAPQPSQQLFPKDEILVLGEEERVEKARKKIELAGREEDPASVIDGYELRALEITEASPCAGKSIRQSGVRDRYHALVVGIERNGKRIINPDSDLRIEAGDTLWVVGESSKVGELMLAMHPSSS
jgi:CPA2 family monovalent cation:H+ antiporter-2